MTENIDISILDGVTAATKGSEAVNANSSHIGYRREDGESGIVIDFGESGNGKRITERLKTARALVFTHSHPDHIDGLIREMKRKEGYNFTIKTVENGRKKRIKVPFIASTGTIEYFKHKAAANGIDCSGIVFLAHDSNGRYEQVPEDMPGIGIKKRAVDHQALGYTPSDILLDDGNAKMTISLFDVNHGSPGSVAVGIEIEKQDKSPFKILHHGDWRYDAYCTDWAGIKDFTKGGIDVLMMESTLAIESLPDRRTINVAELPPGIRQMFEKNPDKVIRAIRNAEAHKKAREKADEVLSQEERDAGLKAPREGDLTELLADMKRHIATYGENARFVCSGQDFTTRDFFISTAIRALTETGMIDHDARVDVISHNAPLVAERVNALKESSPSRQYNANPTTAYRRFDPNNPADAGAFIHIDDEVDRTKPAPEANLADLGGNIYRRYHPRSSGHANHMDVRHQIEWVAANNFAAGKPLTVIPVHGNATSTLALDRIVEGIDNGGLLVTVSSKGQGHLRVGATLSFDGDGNGTVIGGDTNDNDGRLMQAVEKNRKYSTLSNDIFASLGDPGMERGKRLAFEKKKRELKSK